ncbi:hypothetical protein HK405_012251, partial [Cladochytrium tenue]
MRAGAAATAVRRPGFGSAEHEDRQRRQPPSQPKLKQQQQTKGSLQAARSTAAAPPPPADPLDESVYTLLADAVAAATGATRSRTYFRSKHASRIQLEHLAARRGGGGGGGRGSAPPPPHPPPRVARGTGSSPATSAAAEPVVRAGGRKGGSALNSDSPSGLSLFIYSLHPPIHLLGIFGSTGAAVPTAEDVPEEDVQLFTAVAHTVAGCDDDRDNDGPAAEMASLAPVQRRRALGGTGSNGSIGSGVDAPVRTTGVAGAGGAPRRLLPESERVAVLAGLRTNHQALLGVYNRLPVTNDTTAKANR